MPFILALVLTKIIYPIAAITILDYLSIFCKNLNLIMVIFY
jgi:hypothetical protein